MSTYVESKAYKISSCAHLFWTPVTFCCLLRSDYILCSVTFPTDERVAVQWLTREQNYVVVQIYDFDGRSWKETQVGIASRVGKKKHDCISEVIARTVDFVLTSCLFE